MDLAVACHKVRDQFNTPVLRLCAYLRAATNGVTFISNCDPRRQMALTITTRRWPVVSQLRLTWCSRVEVRLANVASCDRNNYFFATVPLEQLC